MNFFGKEEKVIAIEAISKLQLDIGDILVLKTGAHLTDETVAKLKERMMVFLAEQGIDNKVLVLSGGMDIAKISTDLD